MQALRRVVAKLQGDTVSTGRNTYVFPKSVRNCLSKGQEKANIVEYAREHTNRIFGGLSRDYPRSVNFQGKPAKLFMFFCFLLPDQ